MSHGTTLRGRFFASMMTIVVVVVGVGALTSHLLMPALFDQRIRAGVGRAAGRGQGPSGPPEATAVVPTHVQDALDQALTITLIVAVVVGLVIASLLAMWLTRRTLRHLNAMERATRRLAGGEYRHPIAVPEEIELAGLANSINSLGSALAATERTRARLISDLAHELRNPLATIEGYMEGLIDGVLPPTQETYATIATEAHRLQRLTADLSLLSRAQEGELDLKIAPADLKEIAIAVADRLQPQFDAKGVTLTRHFPDSLPVDADSDRINQALTNLVGNALAHTPKGGSVSLRGESDGRVGKVVVSDSGEGIDPGRLDEIFERFTRLDASGAGTGIGLNIARTIARLHEGDITAYSRGPGTGAIFTLSLPRAARV
jgi:signal transduction histidine kinase